jgi:phosphoribosylformylglycinamidine synthase
MDNIAGICKTGRNVFGMMPYPERAAEDALGENSGKLLFDSLVSAGVMATSA